MYTYNLSFMPGSKPASITEISCEVQMEIGNKFFVYDDGVSYEVVDIDSYMDDHTTVHTLICEQLTERTVH